MTIMPELMRPIEDGGQLGPLRVRRALWHLQHHPGRRLHSGHDLPTARTLRRARARAGALRPAHAAAGMGRRGHRRNAGDGARGRRADPRSPSLSGAPRQLPGPDVAIRCGRAGIPAFEISHSDARLGTMWRIHIAEGLRPAPRCRWLGLVARQRGASEWSRREERSSTDDERTRVRIGCAGLGVRGGNTSRAVRPESGHSPRDGAWSRRATGGGHAGGSARWPRRKPPQPRRQRAIRSRSAHPTT